MPDKGYVWTFATWGWFSDEPEEIEVESGVVYASGTLEGTYAVHPFIVNVIEAADIIGTIDAPTIVGRVS